MKKKKIAALVTVSAMMVSLAACGAPKSDDSASSKSVQASSSAEASSSSKASSDEQYTFYMVDPYVGYFYCDQVYEGSLDAAEELGNVEIVRVGPTQINADEHIKFLDTAVASQPDGIFISTLEPDTYKDPVNDAMAKGVPVITYDCDSPDSDRISYYGTSNYNAGYEAGLAMIEATGGNATVAIITGSITAQNNIDRMAGFTDALAEEEGMDIVVTEASDNDLTKATEKAQTILTTYPEVNAIFGTTGSDGQGAAIVAKERGLSADDITIIGFDDDKDLLNLIDEGYVYGTIVQNTHAMGYDSVMHLYKIATGEVKAEKATDGTDVVDTGVILVTKDNLETYKDEM